MTDTQVTTIILAAVVYGYIYGLRNKENGKWYIGQTSADPYYYIRDSYLWHRGAGRSKLEPALKKYGYKGFDICILDSAYSLADLNLLETEYIKEYDSVENGYNCMSGGKSGGHHSPETCAKISAANIGNQSRLGIPHTEATKKLLSEDRLGEKHWNYGKPGYFTGHTHTEESKELMSASATERIVTPETRELIGQAAEDTWNNLSQEEYDIWCKNISSAKMGDKNPNFGKPSWNKGKTMSPEHCKKNREAHMGKPSPMKDKKHTPEALKKMIIAGKKRGDPMKDKTEEEKKQSLQKIRDAWAAKSPEERAAIILKRTEASAKTRAAKLLSKQANESLYGPFSEFM